MLDFLKQSMGVRKRVVVPARQATKASVIDSLELILAGLLKSLKNSG